MSSGELFFSILIGLSVAAGTTIIWSVFQWRSIYVQSVVNKKLRKHRGKPWPWVTVLVYASGSTGGVRKTLRSIKKNRYPNMDIVLVDISNPGGIFKARTAKNAALRAGYRRSKRGQIILTVPAGWLISNKALKYSGVLRLEKNFWHLDAKPRPMDKYLSLHKIINSLESCVWHDDSRVTGYSVKKFYQATRPVDPEYYFPLDEVELSVVRAWFGVLLFGCVLILALSFNLSIIWHAWIAVTFYSLFTVWLRAGYSLRDRFILTLLAPLTLFILPVAYIMRGFSHFKLMK